jgi:hypothetical protein
MVEVFDGLTQEYKDMLFTRFSPSRIEQELSPNEARLIVFFDDSYTRQKHSPDLRFVLSAHFSNFGFFIPSGDSVLISFRLDPSKLKHELHSKNTKWQR